MIIPGIALFAASGTLTPGPTTTLSPPDCTGDSLLVLIIAVTHAGGSLSFSLSDNKGSVFVHLPASVIGNVKEQVIYVINPSPGSGWVITVNGEIDQQFKIAGIGYQGTDGFQNQILNTLSSGSSLSAGILSLPIGPLVVTGLGSLGAASGFDSVSPLSWSTSGTGNASFNGSSATIRGLNNSFPSTITPVWSWTGTHAPASMVAAVFLPASAPVPNVVGMSLANATSTLEAASFELGGVSGLGTVVTQTPAAGVLAPIGWEVDLTLTYVEAPSPPSHVIPLITCTPTTIVTSPSRASGCNQGGIGWTPSYLGSSGSVPIGADPSDGEILTGKRIVRIWAEVNHVND